MSQENELWTGDPDTIPVRTGRGNVITLEEGVDGILSQLDDFRVYLDNDPDATENVIKGFEAARYLVREWHLRKSQNVRCHCDTGTDPERDEDGFWVCAGCGDLLMTPSEDRKTEPASIQST